MKYFLITTEVPLKNGWVKNTATINCKNNIFGGKEISELILKLIKEKNPEAEPLGNPNILFVMEITKKQCDYYENH